MLRSWWRRASNASANASSAAVAAQRRGVHTTYPSGQLSPAFGKSFGSRGPSSVKNNPLLHGIRPPKSQSAGAAASRAALQKMPAHGKQFHYAAFDPNPDSTGAKIGEVILVKKHGIDLLHDPLFNKGSAFPLSERERMGLRGLVPPRVYNKKTVLSNQVARVMNAFHGFRNKLNQYTYMVALQDRNETLFYRCLMEHLELLAPIIYTPTVGLACQEYASIWRRARGMYFSALDVGNMHSMAFNWPIDDVQIIVVTDGSRILGLGDLGANGMGIPIGKLSLYTACAGVHPSRCLPVLIDVGTNNDHYLTDPMYLGLQQKRVAGTEYYAIVDEFIRAVSERWPKALIQFEDFSNDHAYPLLEKYRNKMLCFNDDIQGTGAVAVASLLSAVRALGQRDKNALCNHRIIMVGGGSAGLGIANSIVYAMTEMGLSEHEARQRFWIIDDKGLLGAGRSQFVGLQQQWVRHDFANGLSILDTIKQVKPTVIIGVTGVGGIFTEAAIREMHKHCPKPIIFPLSNPTDHAECTAQQAFEWTNGECVFASGSPFQPVVVNGKTCYPTQSNNMFVFPGIGLGATAIQARMISPKMLSTVSTTLATLTREEDLKQGKILPRLRDIRSVSFEIAVAMAKTAYEEGHAVNPPAGGEEGLRTMIANNMWEPNYGSLVRIDSGW